MPLFLFPSGGQYGVVDYSKRNFEVMLLSLGSTDEEVDKWEGIMYMYISRKTLIFLNFCRTRFSSCRKLETYLLLRSQWAYTHRLWAIDRENINIYNRWNRLMVLYESDKDQTFIKSFIILSFVQTVQMFECLNSGQYDRMRNFLGKKT